MGQQQIVIVNVVFIFVVA